MDAWQLAWIAYHGLLLLIGLVAAGVEVAKRPAAEPADIVYEERQAPRPDETWQFTIPESGDAWMARR